MTDKQIIYNCPHISFTDWGTYACKLYDPRDKNCLVKGGNCDSNISCPYKQLKRKEQECEAYKMEAEEGKEINAELKAENEQLKNFHINLVGVKECEIRELAELKADNKHLNDLLNQALKELEQSREAIEKIKELIQKEINDCEHCDDCASCEYNCCTKQILQIISEVENENTAH
jgi:methionine synthase II (cobalamin-independent)